MVENVIPKVFISYSWTKSDLVLQVANRLMSHGVEVVLDKWDLKEGQDKYVFMEQCVNNSDITKVLIFCDKTYTEKANNRTGGVGDETVIISSEVYVELTVFCQSLQNHWEAPRKSNYRQAKLSCSTFSVDNRMH